MKPSFNRKSIALVVGSVFSGSVLFSSFAHAQNMNEKSVKEQASFEQVSSTLPILIKSKSHTPNIFNIKDTNKLVLDFNDVKLSNVDIAAISSDNPLISKVEAKEVGERVRIVVDLKRPAKFKVTSQPNNNYVLELISANAFENLSTSVINPPAKKEQVVLPKAILDTTPEVTKQYGLTEEEKLNLIAKVNSSVNKTKKVTVTTTTVVVPKQTVSHLEVNHINIKPTEDKNARIIIDFNDSAITPVFLKTDNSLIVDFKGVAMPAKLQQNINTKVLGTLLQNVDIATQKGNARLVLTQKDGWDYSFYQMDKRLVIEIKNKKEEAVEKTYKGKPLSMNFQNMDVRAILQTIADFTNLNIMASDAVQGTMTIRLKDVPWDQALNSVMELNNLQKVQEGNVIWIATRQEISDKNKSALELQAQQAELAPLKLEFFTLNHYKAPELKAVLEGKSAAGGGGETKPLGLISKRGSVGLDIRNNTLFVQDNEESLVEIRKIIKRLDMPTRQVLIEAKLVIATDNFEKNLGAKFGIGGGKRNGSTGYGIGNSLGDSQSYAGGPTSPTGGTGFNLPVTGGGALGFTILNSALGNHLSFELSALERNNLGKVISNPRLLTSDNKKAVIRQGTQIPYTIPGTANSAPTVSFKDAVLSLGVTPQVSPNGRIVLNLDISKDTVGQMISLPGGGQVPSIDTRSITTEITIKDGQTVVLGGVYEITSANDINKVPFFGDIPFLGNLFKNNGKTDQKAELLIFITPHIVNDEDLDAINDNQTKAPQEIDLSK